MNLKLPVLKIKSNDNNLFMIAGYASIFNEADYHHDVIEQGAFQKSIAKHRGGEKIKLLWQHDPTKPIGIINTIEEDDKGLMITASINRSICQGQEVIALINQGALDSFSIGFNIAKFVVDKDGYRHILELDLWEISVVTFPANSNAKIWPPGNQLANNTNCVDLLPYVASKSKSIFIF